MKIKFSIFMPLVLMLLLNGCVLFTSHYDATRHENFTRLKAMHFKLFDNWSEASDRVWKESEVSAYCDKGDLSFREAFEYAKSKDDSDKTGQKAVKILWEEFTANCKFSLKKKKLFSQAFLKELTPQIELNYNYAIAGELSRVVAR
ncbi:MAG: hypothetical protein ACN4GM_10125 [Gammaproteobacteria bacterium]